MLNVKHMEIKQMSVQRHSRKNRQNQNLRNANKKPKESAETSVSKGATHPINPNFAPQENIQHNF